MIHATARAWNLITAVTLALAAMWIGVSAMPPGSTTNGRIPAPRQGFAAPEMSLANLEGDNVSLVDLRGQPLMINFWATWCPPCRAEMPAIQKVYDDYRDKGLVVLMVNATYNDSEDAARAYLAEGGYTFPVLLDARGDAARQYLINSLPTTIFIGRDGVISQLVIGGPMSEALLRAETERILAETP